MDPAPTLCRGGAALIPEASPPLPVSAHSDFAGLNSNVKMLGALRRAARSGKWQRVRRMSSGVSHEEEVKEMNKWRVSLMDD